MILGNRRRVGEKRSTILLRNGKFDYEGVERVEEEWAIAAERRDRIGQGKWLIYGSLQ